MKKFISLFLCIVLMCFTLTSCKEKIIGEDLKNRGDNTNKNTALETLNMYIIAGENTLDTAQESVLTNINVYLKETYEVQLKIFFCTEENYVTMVTDSLKDGVEEKDRADIVLINSVDLFNTLYNGNKLASLTSFYNNKDYVKLNAIVEDNLLSSSLVKDRIPGENGAEDTYEDNYYTIPNNHRIGEYQYIVIDKARARELNYSSWRIAEMNNPDKIDEYNEAFLNGTTSETPYIELKTGTYEDKVLLEANNTKFVNIASYPNATKAEAFSSAYAVIKNLNDVGKLTEEEAAIINNHYTKCVDIIYALNNDPQLLNMLQYGYVGTNYSFITDEKNQNTNYITMKGAPNTGVYYYMNRVYTGNPYIAYYCDQQGWNETVHSNVLKQNAASYTLSEKIAEESERIAAIGNQVFDLTDTTEDSVRVWDNGSMHGDVKITWNLSSDSLVVNNVKNALYLTVSEKLNAVDVDDSITEDYETLTETVTVTATLTCVDNSSGEKAEAVIEFTVEIISIEVASATA